MVVIDMKRTVIVDMEDVTMIDMVKIEILIGTERMTAMAETVTGLAGQAIDTETIVTGTTITMRINTARAEEVIDIVTSREATKTILIEHKMMLTTTLQGVFPG